MTDHSTSEPTAVERLSMRALLQLARTRLGPGASALKTREELVAALRGRPTEPVVARPNDAPIVVRDFFVRQS